METEEINAGFLSGLSYHRLDIYITADADVEIRGWLGAVLRNNLLYAASGIMVSEETSLLDEINSFPLEETHPLYPSMKGGFPKFYVISLQSPERFLTPRFRLGYGQGIGFSLLLIGPAAHYHKEFVEALRRMCNRGFGFPMTPFTLHEIYEDDCCGRSSRIAVRESETIADLRYPVSVGDFKKENFGQVESTLRIVFDTPVLLADSLRKKDRTVSYQDKMNAFPSFYQFVRSAISRMWNLALLYAMKEGDSTVAPDYSKVMDQEDFLEEYLDEAASAHLLEAAVHWSRIPGPFRNDGRVPMQFTGYVGEMVYAGDFSRYIPMLEFVRALGNGNDTVYGLGAYHMEVLQCINKNKIK